MTRDTGYLLLTLLLFFFAPRCFGQDENKSVELKQILGNISEQHHIKFSFAENDVAGHSIFPPENRWPLPVKLTYITNRTLLKFKQSGIYVTVYQPLNNEPPAKNRCAFVTDENGVTLENAIVQYNDVRLLTGTNGYFEFPATVKLLVIEQLGYNTLQYSLPETYGDCAEIRLTPEIHELSEIVTERYIATGISVQKSGSYNIKPSKFGILPGLTEADVLKAMQQLPGINSIDETVNNINVRGGTHDQNLFSWNGIRLFQTGHFFGLISALNPNLAHNVEIFKNGTSALYGESVSSNVNITSHPREIDNTHGSIGTNMIGPDAHLYIKTSPVSSLELTGRRSFTDVLDFPTYTQYSKRIFQNTVVSSLENNDLLYYQSDKEFYFYDLTANYHHIIGKKHHLYADFITIQNNLDFTQGTFMPYGLVVKTSSLNQSTLGGNLLFKSQWNNTHSSEASAYVSYYNVDALNMALQYDSSTLQQNIILDTGLRLQHNYKASDKLNFTGGYQYNETGIKNRDLTNRPVYSREIKEVLRTHALVGQAEYSTLTSPWYVQGGLRLNYIEKFGLLYAEPRLNVSYKLNNSWKLQFQGERKSQTSSQIVALQQDFLGIEKRRWVLANNKDIPVQHSSQAAVGFTFKQNGWLISLDNFYKRVSGITTEGQAFQNQFELEKATGRYLVWGSEFLVQKQFKQFYIWLSYAFNHNRYRFNTLYPPVFTNSFEQPHTVTNAVTYEWKNLKISLGSKIMSGRPYTSPQLSIPVPGENQPYIAYDYPNGTRLGTYAQVNFSAGYNLPLYKKTRLQLGLSVLNILNRSNTINRYYELNEPQTGIDVINTYSLSRTLNAMIRVAF